MTYSIIETGLDDVESKHPNLSRAIAYWDDQCAVRDVLDGKEIVRPTTFPLHHAIRNDETGNYVDLSIIFNPDACHHNPDPTYIRRLLDDAGISQRQAAKRIGISERMMRYYVADPASGDHRPAPYLVQYALEQLAR